MSSESTRGKGTLCPAEPLLRAINNLTKIEDLLKSQNKLTKVQTCLGLAEKIVRKLIPCLKNKELKLRFKKYKPTKKPETNVVTRLIWLEEQFIEVCGYMDSELKRDYDSNIFPAAAFIIEGILSVLGIGEFQICTDIEACTDIENWLSTENELELVCFFNTGRGYPYQDVTFTFGMLYLDVGKASRETIRALSKYTEPEKHEWISCSC